MRRLVSLLCALGLLSASVLVLRGQQYFPPVSSLPSGSTVTVGTGGASATVGGVLQTQYTPVSNTSINVEDVLMTYTMPAATLISDGQGVRITVGGTFAANTNTKNARLFFGATQLQTTGSQVGAPNATGWRMVAECLRTSATAQICTSFAHVAGATGWTTTITPAETLSGAVTMTVRGLSVTAATDVTAKLLVVEALR